MPKKVTPLSDTKVKSSKVKDVNYTLSDGDGLQLLIKTNGVKVWQFIFPSPTHKKRRKTTFGNYPALSLKKAREKRTDYLELITQGIDPVDHFESLNNAEERDKEGQFHLVVQAWIDSLLIADITRSKKIRAFERDIFPYFSKYDKEHNLISSTHIKMIQHYELLHALKEKSTMAQETAVRILADCRNIWQFAFEQGYVDEVITAKIGKKALPRPQKKHLPKITDEAILGELLRAIDVYQGHAITRLMLNLLALIPLRADNLTTLRWDMIDFDKETLTIPRQEMKEKNINYGDFTLPLPRQAIEILKELQQLTGWGKFVFHGLRNIHSSINNETGNKALRTLGFTDESLGRKQTQHSFRGTYRSLTDTHQTQHNAIYEVKEMVLDHHKQDKSADAYLHAADYTEQMRALLQWWADHLDEIKKVNEEN